LHGTSRGSSSTTSPMPRVQVPRHVARLAIDYFAYAARPDASARRTARHAARRRLLRVRRTSGCLDTLHDSSSTTSRTLRVRVPQHVTRLVVDYFAYAVRPGVSARRTTRRAARRRLLHLRRASGCLGLSRGLLSITSRTPRVRMPRHVARPVARLVIDYFAYAARPGASSRCAARRRLLRVRCASGCLGTSRGSSSTTSRTPCVRVSQHVARHVARLAVDYFTYAARLGASACRAARRRLLRVRHAFGCLSTLRGTSSTTSRKLRIRVPRHVARLVVDYFAHTARPGASAPRAACRVARRVVRRRLLRVRHASGCLGTSRGSSSTTSPTPRVRVPRHLAQLVARPVIDYFAYAARPGASARRAARHRLIRLRRASGCLGTSRDSSRGSSHRSSSTTPCAATSSCGHTCSTSTTSCVTRDYLSRGNTGSTSSTPHAAAMSSFGGIASTIHLD
jgi:hypothetical protein